MKKFDLRAKQIHLSAVRAQVSLFKRLFPCHRIPDGNSDGIFN